MECVAVCPAEHALQLSLPPRQLPEITSATNRTTLTRWQYRAIRPEAIAAVLALLFFGLIGLARVTGHWQTNIPQDVHRQMVPHADEYDH
jgi:hypothetical protein